MKLMKRALSTLLAGVFAASMCILPALADEAPALKVNDPTYTVTISGGNQGTVSVAGEEGSSVAIPVAAGNTFSSSITVHVTNDKYYVKGLRDSSVNNAYIDDYVANNSTVSENGIYTLTPSIEVTSDINLVVAYGIKGEMVNYSVQYKYGDTLLGEPDTFTAQLGDTPAPIAKYIEGYIPDANQKALTLDANNKVITFNYYKLPPNYRTIYENETIYIITPEGEQVPVTPVTPEEAAAGAVPVVTEAGETILDADGNPLAAPIDEENLDDNANPLASANGEAGISTQAADAASILSWLLPLLAAVVVAGLVVFFALLIRNKRKDNENS